MRTLVLASVISVRDFGLMGIGKIAVVTSETFSRNGLDRGLIRRRRILDGIEVEYEDLDASWRHAGYPGVLCQDAPGSGL